MVRRRALRRDRAVVRSAGRTPGRCPTHERCAGRRLPPHCSGGCAAGGDAARAGGQLRSLDRGGGARPARNSLKRLRRTTRTSAATGTGPGVPRRCRPRGEHCMLLLTSRMTAIDHTTASRATSRTTAVCPGPHPWSRLEVAGYTPGRTSGSTGDDRSNVLRVAVTGGIGSGKSTVSARLAERGAVVVDSDRLAREVVAVGTPGLAAVVERFGAAVLAADGSLNRPALAAIVFSDPAARRALEGITHPRVRARFDELAAAAPADAVVVNDIPLLVALPVAAVVPSGGRGRRGRRDADRAGWSVAGSPSRTPGPGSPPRSTMTRGGRSPTSGWTTAAAGRAGRRSRPAVGRPGWRRSTRTAGPRGGRLPAAVRCSCRPTRLGRSTRPGCWPGWAARRGTTRCGWTTSARPPFPVCRPRTCSTCSSWWPTWPWPPAGPRWPRAGFVPVPGVDDDNPHPAARRSGPLAQDASTPTPIPAAR